MLGNTKYSFWWIPKPVTGRHSTRAQKGTPTEPYRNVMYDKRVVRGSNYGATSIELDMFNKAAEWRRRNVLRKKVLMRNQRNVIGTPPPVMGRRHEVIQTDKYLEELLEHPPVRTADTQTDLFLDPPSTPPPFIKSKIGVDVGTTIETGDLAPAEVCSADDDDLPLIERFIEACITDTAQELLTEVNITCIEGGGNEVKLKKTESDEIGQFTATKFLERHNAMEKLEHDATMGERFITSCSPSGKITEEVTQIVDSNEILMVIIEEIIKQREEAHAAAAIEQTTEFERRRTESVEPDSPS